MLYNILIILFINTFCQLDSKFYLKVKCIYFLSVHSNRNSPPQLLIRKHYKVIQLFYTTSLIRTSFLTVFSLYGIFCLICIQKAYSIQWISSLHKYLIHLEYQLEQSIQLNVHQGFPGKLFEVSLQYMLVTGLMFALIICHLFLGFSYVVLLLFFILLILWIWSRCGGLNVYYYFVKFDFHRCRERSSTRI